MNPNDIWAFVGSAAIAVGSFIILYGPCCEIEDAWIAFMGRKDREESLRVELALRALCVSALESRRAAMQEKLTKAIRSKEKRSHIRKALQALTTRILTLQALPKVAAQ